MVELTVNLIRKYNQLEPAGYLSDIFQLRSRIALARGVRRVVKNQEPRPVVVLDVFKR